VLVDQEQFGSWDNNLASKHY